MIQAAGRLMSCAKTKYCIRMALIQMRVVAVNYPEIPDSWIRVIYHLVELHEMVTKEPKQPS